MAELKNYGKPFRSSSMESKIITLSYNFLGEILCLREKVENMSDAAKINGNNSERLSAKLIKFENVVWPSNYIFMKILGLFLIIIVVVVFFSYALLFTHSKNNNNLHYKSKNHTSLWFVFVYAFH